MSFFSKLVCPGKVVRCAWLCLTLEQAGRPAQEGYEAPGSPSKAASLYSSLSDSAAYRWEN